MTQTMCHLRRAVHRAVHRVMRRIPHLFGLAVFLALCACGGRVELLTGIPEQEVNEVLGTLLDSGIKAEKLPGKDGLVGLAVESSQAARAIAIMRAEGLPRDRHSTIGEVFRKEGLISSPLEERARYLWALSQELSATIADIDGVIKARVHVVLPERSSGGDPAVPSSSAVYIKYKRSYNLDDAIPQIKRLVTNSIPGLSSEKVSVVLVPAIPAPTAAMALASQDAAPDALAGAWNPTSISLLILLLLALVAIAYLAWRMRTAAPAATEPKPPVKTSTANT